MKAKCDEHEIELTDRFLSSLRRLGVAYLDMMQKGDPQYAGCWTWLRITVGDMSLSNSISFQGGGDEDKPEGMVDTVEIVSQMDLQEKTK